MPTKWDIFQKYVQKLFSNLSNDILIRMLCHILCSIYFKFIKFCISFISQFCISWRSYFYFKFFISCILHLVFLVRSTRSISSICTRHHNFCLVTFLVHPSMRKYLKLAKKNMPSARCSDLVFPPSFLCAQMKILFFLFWDLWKS